MSKFMPSASSIVVRSIFAIHLLNDAEFLNATSVVRLRRAKGISPLTEM